MLDLVYSSLASNEANEEMTGKVSKIIANKIGQSTSIYERNKKIIEEGNEEQKNRLRENKESTNKIYNDIVKAKRKDELLKNSKISLSDNDNSSTTSNNSNTYYKLYLGDFIEKGQEISNEMYSPHFH